MIIKKNEIYIASLHRQDIKLRYCFNLNNYFASWCLFQGLFLAVLVMTQCGSREGAIRTHLRTRAHMLIPSHAHLFTQLWMCINSYLYNNEGFVSGVYVAYLQLNEATTGILYESAHTRRKIFFFNILINISS